MSPTASWSRSTAASTAGLKIVPSPAPCWCLWTTPRASCCTCGLCRARARSSYFAALRGYLHEHGCRVAIYSDKHSVFRVTRQGAKGGQGTTQFGRALSELNIEILCANSSQAKGRVERANRTLQDRLVKELRPRRRQQHGSWQHLLAYVHGTLQRAVRGAALPNAGPPPSAADDHSRLNDILCHREQRYVGAQLTFHYDRKQNILEQTEVAKGLKGQYVELFDYWDRPLEVRWRGHILPYRVFSKDQRVGHTATVENKRLGMRSPSSRLNRTSGSLRRS